ncbi:helix-turn-helix domain-containing protein [Streptomyces sp. NPDC088387]|uniref:helix-turn-helix domain-containing protein n=1 Tax=Streptomyces sp. NPDC088387 TaxID=3365859 RepID=UPI0037FDEA3A
MCVRCRRITGGAPGTEHGPGRQGFPDPRRPGPRCVHRSHNRTCFLYKPAAYAELPHTTTRPVEGFRSFNGAGAQWGPYAEPQDHIKPVVTRLTNNQAGQSVCRVPRDLTDDPWRPDRQRIGRAIRDARIAHNLTQESVILAIPMNRSYYQDIEAGLANPTLETLLDIASAIGVPLSHLVR